MGPWNLVLQVDLSMNRCVVFLLISALLLDDVGEICLEQLAGDRLTLIALLRHFKLALVIVSIVFEGVFD